MSRITYVSTITLLATDNDIFVQGTRKKNPVREYRPTSLHSREGVGECQINAWKMRKK